LGRKNCLFCGSEGGGQRAALMYSMIESAKHNVIEPNAYLLDVLDALTKMSGGHIGINGPRAFNCANDAPLT
jgi:hypothetical protein